MITHEWEGRAGRREGGREVFLNACGQDEKRLSVEETATREREREREIRVRKREKRLRRGEMGETTF